MSMDLKARIAARKAAMMALSGEVQTITQEQANHDTVLDVIAKDISPLEAMGLDDSSAPTMTQEKFEEEYLQKPEPPASEQKKPMTFAERIAEKKRLAEGAAPVLTAPTATKTTALSVPPTEPKSISLTEEQLAVIQAEENSELAQAYSDVALMVNKLQYALDGEPLANAMADLKRALKQNASACMLILDSDIGQMTLALRRHTGVELQEATKEKKSTGTKAKKASNMTLTPEEIQLALATDF